LSLERVKDGASHDYKGFVESRARGEGGDMSKEKNSPGYSIRKSKKRERSLRQENNRQNPREREKTRRPLLELKAEKGKIKVKEKTSSCSTRQGKSIERTDHASGTPRQEK